MPRGRGSGNRGEHFPEGTIPSALRLLPHLITGLLGQEWGGAGAGPVVSTGHPSLMRVSRGRGGGAREGTGPSSRQLLTPGHRAAFPTTREFLELEQGAPHGTETPTGKKYALALLSREARILRVVREPSFRPGPPRRFHFPEFVSSLSLGPAVPGSSDRGLSALICCLVALPLRFPPSAHNPVLSTSVFTPRTAQESGRRCGAGGARRSPSRGICLMPAEY